MDFDQDWKKAMKKARCRHVKYVKMVKHELVEDPQGMAYWAVVLYLEKKYRKGILRAKAEVDTALLEIHPRPEFVLCDELITHVKAMDMKAKEKA